MGDTTILNEILRKDEKSTISNITVATDELRLKIVGDILQPNYYQQVQTLTKSSNRWMVAGNICEAGGKVFLVAGGIVSFAAGFFNNLYLSFISGSISSVSAGLLIFANYSHKESSERNKQLSILLETLQISKVPDVVIAD